MPRPCPFFGRPNAAERPQHEQGGSAVSANIADGSFLRFSIGYPVTHSKPGKATIAPLDPECVNRFDGFAANNRQQLGKDERVGDGNAKKLRGKPELLESASGLRNITCEAQPIPSRRSLRTWSPRTLH
jgi:hypothetical protein